MWWAAAALAGTDLTVGEGLLRPGRSAELLVASTDANGEPATRPPPVAVRGATVRGPIDVRPGVWRLSLLPAIDSVRVEVEAGGTARDWPVEPPPRSDLVVPTVVDALARGGEVTFTVASPHGPLTPNDVEIAVGEGRVVSVQDERTHLAVTLALGDLPYPRWVPVAVVDRTRDVEPAWVGIRVRARPRVPLTAEPGARLELKVGPRSYGPFIADASGAIEGRVDQYPGESYASAVLFDDLGNVTRTEVPLASQNASALVAVATGPQVSGWPPPAVYVHALSPTGSGPSTALTCKTPSGAVSSRAVDERTWWVPLPATTGPVDQRLACAIGPALAEVRVPVAGIPERLTLRLAPQQLSTDYPHSDVTVALEDARGERLPVDEVVVRAERGTLVMEGGTGIVGRGEYDGTNVAAAEDRVTAAYHAPPGEGAVAEIGFGWGERGEDGRPIYARALDSLRRPLADVPIRVTVGSEDREVRTGPDGWAQTTLVRETFDPTLLRATAGRAVEHAWVLPLDPASGGPGTPDLASSVSISLRPGRIGGISVGVTPPILRAAADARARVVVKLEDGIGQPITDEPVQLEVSAGEVGDLKPRADGSRVAEYRPGPVSRRREVVITARTSTVRSSATLVVEPRLVRWTLGAWVGAQTNFGAIAAPAAGIDLELRPRSRLTGDGVSMRLGAAGTSFGTSVDLGTGQVVDLRAVLVPFSGTFLARGERGPTSLWAGVGLQAGPMWTTADSASFATRGVNLVGGPHATAGLGWRGPGGELLVSVTGVWLPANAGVLGYDGNLGGLVAAIGYRLAL